MSMARKVIISGGGTGGHIFPAIAIAGALRRIEPDIEILFVGAKGRMEMQKVPEAGYEIVGLDIQGINRKSFVKNLSLPFKMARSLWQANKILKKFGAEAAIGVGGFASGPLLLVAGWMGIPTLLQEQNSYAGLTNKRLSKKAEKVCVAFDGMERYFPSEKIIFTGNPIRRSSVELEGKRDAAYQHFGLDPDKKTLLLVGGSLGALTLNRCMQEGVSKLVSQGMQVIWQCGANYYQRLKAEVSKELLGSVRLTAFIDKMDYAYAAADLIVARAGAGTISELCVVAKPTILVPSPNVAEDHQTKNALALMNAKAALMVTDWNARAELMDKIIELKNDEDLCKALSSNIKAMAIEDADDRIAREILKMINKG